MNKAIITDNKVFCSNNHHSYKVNAKEYKEVEIAGNKYTKFVARCKLCEDIFYYFAQLRIEEDRYFMFDEEQESEIKEEKKGIKIDE